MTIDPAGDSVAQNAELAPLSTGRAERRWATVLMLDIVGSTELLQQIGPEKSFEMTQSVMAKVAAAIKAHGGFSMGFEGDGLLASFGAPIASEEAALDAVKAALACRDDLAGATQALNRRYGCAPQFRIAVCAGAVVIVPQHVTGHTNGPRIHGPAVNLSARLQAIAEPGQIVVSDEVATQIAGIAKIRPLGHRRFKGFAQPVTVFELSGFKRSGPRFGARAHQGLSSFVGREAERAALTHFVAQQSKGWRVIALVGPAGIGKSRLVHEVQSATAAPPSFLIGQCRTTDQARPYGPFAQILRQAVHANDALPSEQVLKRLEARIGAGIVTEDLRLILDAATPKQTPDTKGVEKTLYLRRSLRRVLEALCADDASVLVIEDAHWLDFSSRDLIKSLLSDPSARYACPLLITTRPEGAGWISGPSTEIAELSSLGLADAFQLTEDLLSEGQFSRDLPQLVFEKSEGNPLFIEEIVKYLRNESALKREEIAAQDLGAVAAIGDIQYLFLHQVDRLPEYARRMLQYAAVIGHAFQTDLLRRVVPSGSTNDLEQALATAVRAGLIFATPSDEGGAYRFGHVLLRDAIYASLLETTRRELHLATGMALEALMPARATDEDMHLSDHFDRAGAVERAIPYWLRAAKRARQIYALHEVDAILTRVAEVVRSRPDLLDDLTVADFVTDWLDSLEFLANHVRVVTVAEEFLPRLRAMEDQSHTTLALAQYCLALTHLRDYPRAFAIASKAVKEAGLRGDRKGFVWMNLPLIRYYEETLSLPNQKFLDMTDALFAEASALKETRAAMQYIYMRAAYFRSLGDVKAARIENRRLDEYAAAQGDTRGRIFYCWTEALCLQIAEEIEQALEVIDEGRRHILPGTGDEWALLSIWCALITLGPSPDVAQDELDRVYNIVLANGEYNLIDPNRLTKTVYKLRKRDLAAGWSDLQELLRGVKKRGNRTHLRYFYLVTAEFLLTVCGRLPSGKVNETAARKLSVADIVTGLTLKLTGRFRARRMLRQFWRLLPQKHDCVLQARALICEAVLAKGDARRDKLAQAKRIAHVQELTNLANRIDKLMAQT